MNNLQPGDTIVIHIVSTGNTYSNNLIRVEHKRQDQTLKPPTLKELKRLLFDQTRLWSKNTAGLPIMGMQAP